MAAAKFCSECGERLKVGRISFLPFRSFCTHCSPRFKRARLMLIAAGAMCAVLGFVIGRYADAPREHFHFIGTPIGTSAGSVATSPDDKAARSSHESGGLTRPEQLVILPSSTHEICGARTRSGKSCQRKVKGGGYCWQHREKFGEKEPGGPQRP